MNKVNTTKIKEILDMPEWNDPRFKSLLTSGIWHRNADEVKKIISMSEWNDPKFKNLLTSCIWHSNAEEVKEILDMPELQCEEYKQLLCPTIFAINKKNILSNIELLKEYGIDKYITVSFLRKNVDKQRALIDYMISKDIDLIVEDNKGSYKLNPMFNYSSSVLKSRYGINMKEIKNNKIKKLDK